MQLNQQAPPSHDSNNYVSTSDSSGRTSSYCGSDFFSAQAESCGRDTKEDMYLRKIARDRVVRAQTEGQTVTDCCELFDEFFGSSSKKTSELVREQSYRMKIEGSDRGENYAEEKIFALRMVTKINAGNSTGVFCSCPNF